MALKDMRKKYEGLSFINKNNEKYIIKRYFNATLVLVYFPNTDTEKYAAMNSIKKGQVKNPIHGIKNPAIVKNRIGLKITNGIGLAMQVIEQRPEYVKIRFDISRSERWVKTDLFMNGEVKDFFHRSVFNIGFLGNHDTKDENHQKAYRTWKEMLRRCYTDKYHDSNVFCYISVEVDERWHCYANFQQDIKQIEGYNKWLSDNTWDLDKDAMSGKIKLYSKDTCIFVSHSDNVSLRKVGVLSH